jgi:hypothetical protein
MSWYCVIIVDGEARDVSPVAFVESLRHAYRDAGAPGGATAFVNRGSASRSTFLLSPEAATLSGELLRRHGALACARTPSLARYAPVRL